MTVGEFKKCKFGGEICNKKFIDWIWRNMPALGLWAEANFASSVRCTAQRPWAFRHIQSITYNNQSIITVDIPAVSRMGTAPHAVRHTSDKSVWCRTRCRSGTELQWLKLNWNNQWNLSYKGQITTPPPAATNSNFASLTLTFDPIIKRVTPRITGNTCVTHV